MFDRVKPKPRVRRWRTVAGELGGPDRHAGMTISLDKSTYQTGEMPLS
jgi:hypothetical protein